MLLKKVIMMYNKIFGQKMEEVTGGLRILHNRELHNLCSLPNIIRMIKSRRVIPMMEKCIKNFRGKS
jgi:hypothetical protein